jgi:hypothetical protein
MTEIWKHIPGYEALYEVSNFGVVRAKTRVVPYGRHGQTTYAARILKQFKSNKYLSVKLSNQGKTTTKYTHHIVLLAFQGSRPHTIERGEIRHLNGDKEDNRLANLAYGTVKENAADRVRHKAGVGK